MTTAGSGDTAGTAGAGDARNPALPLIVMGVVVLVWGLGPPTTKLVTAPPAVGTFIRFGISAPFLIGVLAAMGRPVTRSVMRSTALPGLSFGVNLIFVFSTVQEGTVAVLATMTAMQPLLLLVVAGPVFGERPTSRQLLFTLVGVAGAILVVLGAGAELRATGLGLLFASASTVTFSVYFALTRLARSGDDVDPIAWMAGVNVWAFVATLPPVLLFMRGDDFGQFGGRDWIYIVIVAFVTGVFGHVLMSWVHGYLEAARSSVYVLAMHPVAVGLAWPIHDEPVTWVQVLGGAVLLFGVAMVIRSPARIVAAG